MSQPQSTSSQIMPSSREPSTSGSVSADNGNNSNSNNNNNGVVTAPRASASSSSLSSSSLLAHGAAAAVIGERKTKPNQGQIRARIAELQRQLKRAERDERERDAKAGVPPPTGAGDDDDDDDEDAHDDDLDDNPIYNTPHLLDVYDYDDRSLLSRRDEVALGRAAHAHTTASPARTPMHSSLGSATPTIVPLSSATGDAAGPSRRLLIVTNRLPVSLVKKPKKKEQKDDTSAAAAAAGSEEPEEEWHFTKSSGGLVSALNGVKGIDMTWIGWPGEEIKKADDQKEISTRLLKEQNCVPVFLPKTMCELYYSGFSNGLLWPLFHYMQPAIELIQSAGDQFTAYQQANQAFCDVVLQHYQEGDLIWVHDYHLFLLPALLRAALPSAKIGFFLHIPFPSSELYQTLPWREQLLQGLLASDLVGFHTHDYARHFFISCTRILGLQCTSDGVETANGFSAVGTFPIGIDAGRFKAALRTQSVRDHTKELRRQFSGLRVILGIDRLDYTKGIPHKLFAMERFLQNNPEWVGKVVLVQIAVPSRGDVPEYQRLSKKVHQLVGRINGRFGTLTHVPIHLLDTSIGFDRMCALYRISDCCVVSSIRDGMNLVSYEYISCQSEKQPGVLILSEFTGAAQSLGAGAISVNPWDTEQCAGAILKALTMKEEERREHYRWCYHHVNKHTAQYWADSFVSSLISTNTTLSDPRGARAIPQSLRGPRVAHAFHASRHRMIISGLVGTLSHKRLKGMAKDATGPLFAMASNRIRNMVNELAKDSHTTFLLVTARGRPMCDRIMGRTQAWIAAENGYFLRRGPDAEWETPFDNVDISWIPEVRTKFEYFTQRTPKSFIEERTSYLSWHYHDCDQYFGEKQARELLLNLMSGPLANASMQVFHHARIVQVRPIGVSKAFLVDRLMMELETKKGPIDLALCMGNFPPMDEDVFGACQQRVVPSPGSGSNGHIIGGSGAAPKGSISPLVATRSISTPGQSNGSSATSAALSPAAVTTTITTPPATPSITASASVGLPASELPLSAATPPLNPAKLAAAASMPPLAPLEIPTGESKSSLSSPSRIAGAVTPHSPALAVMTVPRTVFTIAVGRKHSRAAYYLDGMRAVEKLLESLVDALPTQVVSPLLTSAHGSGLGASNVRSLVLPPPSAVPGTAHALIAASMALGSPQPLTTASPLSSHATTVTKADGTITTSSGRPLAAVFNKLSPTGGTTTDDDESDTATHTHTPSSATIPGAPHGSTINVTTGLRLLQSSMSLPDFNGVSHYGDTV